MLSSYPIQEIAEHIGANTVGESHRPLNIDAIAPLNKARGNEISFLDALRYQPYLKTTNAGAIILRQEMVPNEPINSILLIHPNPYLAYAKVSELFDQHYCKPQKPFIHPTAVVHSTAKLAKNVQVGPYATIEADVSIAEGCSIGPHCFIGYGCTLGQHNWLHPHVSIQYKVLIGDHCIFHPGVVIGSDGFGLSMDENNHPVKIYQLGSVHIGNYVEIGSNSTIDRGALDNTVIHDHVKIDNLVLIGHNCIIGENARIAGQSGIAGSVTLGANCILGGQVGIAGHITIADNVAIMAKSGVSKSILKAGVYSAKMPLLEKRQWQKNAIVFRRLTELDKQVKKLSACQLDTGLG